MHKRRDEHLRELETPWLDEFGGGERDEREISVPFVHSPDNLRSATTRPITRIPGCLPFYP